MADNSIIGSLARGDLGAALAGASAMQAELDALSAGDQGPTAEAIEDEVHGETATLSPHEPREGWYRPISALKYHYFDQFRGPGPARWSGPTSLCHRYASDCAHYPERFSRNPAEHRRCTVCAARLATRDRRQAATFTDDELGLD